MAYVLFVVQTREEAAELNANFPEPDVDKFRAVFCGQDILGLNYRGKRPNVIVMDYVELTDKHTRWTNEVLRPCAHRNVIWITEKYEGKS
ncbi:hypothetical protein [Paenibacillus alvei]|uniref:hypothetical protein n=1 Tax=Paenibacillus alvei TaxID=44250 RepID=UPI0018CDAB48|nr:hypothetical protein [Paenibacillus alvei]MBG9736583.1 hypothetical protein [Paenibacillus alvei]MBG9747099.1 hypothetical protein [Paenibacillus alvei]MCY9582491.1 hypothetical protein [Paenibacillus alvei]MCY9587373.1 hypothetical protein [Paenibacillus alvei]